MYFLPVKTEMVKMDFGDLYVLEPRSLWKGRKEKEKPMFQTL